jgi:hypothetical protein
MAFVIPYALNRPNFDALIRSGKAVSHRRRKSRHANLALMKLAHFHRAHGDEVRFTRHVERQRGEPTYDREQSSPSRPTAHARS